MESLTIIGTVSIIFLLGTISPGPDFIMIVKNSLMYSRKTGIWTAVGLGMGTVIHIFYSIAGIAVLISQSVLLFNFIKLLGAGYLIYIGWKSFFSKSSELDFATRKQQKKDISVFKAIKIGFLTNILNPKITLFFLSLFTLIIPASTSFSILIILSIIMVSIIILWFSLVSIFFTQKKVRNIFNKFQGIFNKIFGTLLVALGIRIALFEK